MKTETCYEANFKLLRTLKRESPPQFMSEVRLVHAECRDDIEGTRFGHAYVTVVALNGMVIAHDYSNGRKRCLPVEDYEALGGITEVHRYTYEEAATRAAETGHFGPWDLKTSSGL